MRYVLGIILGVYFGAVILLNIPYVQQKTTLLVAKELSTLLKTEVSIGKVNIGLLNRIIVDDLLLNDQSGKELLRVSRLSAKFNMLSLLRGQISIGSVQLFGFNINLNKESTESDTNFKFIIDAFAPQDSVRKDPLIDLRINSLLIRRGKLAYDVLSEEETPGRFNPQHIKLYNIIGNISLKALSNDSINAHVKRLSVDEQSGLELKKLGLKLLGNEQHMSIENFAIDLPGTSLRMDTIRMDYDSLGSFNRFITDVRFSFRVLPSYITLQDISPFVPAFENFKEKVEIELDADGTIDQLNVPRMAISAENSLRLRGNVSFRDLSEPSEAFIYGDLSHFSANGDGLDFLARNFSENDAGTSKLLRNLGHVLFRGEISGYFTDLVTYGTFQTDMGVLNADIKLSSDKSEGLFSYSGRLKTDEFELGQWLESDKWGKISFNLDVDGSHYKQRKYPSIVLKGLVSTLEYSNYAYENIGLDGEYKSGGFDGKVALDDTNGSILLNGNFNLAEKIPAFNFMAHIEKVRPYDLSLTKKYQDAEFSLKLRANFVGGSIDEMVGTIDVDSVLYEAPGKSFFMDNMHVLATREAGKNKLTVRSEFLSADIEGNYSYRTLPNSVMNMLKRYLPSLYSSTKEVPTSNNLNFDISVFNTDFLSNVFEIPFEVYSHSVFKGYLNDRTNRLRVEGYFPRFRYGSTFVESGMVLLENPSDYLRGHVRFSSYRKKGIVNISLDAQAKNDILTTRLNWGNNSTSTYSGHFHAESNFFRTDGEKSLLKTIVDIKPTNVILNDTVWNIHPSSVVADSGRIHINNFSFGHEDQYVRIDGYASEDINDTVKVNLKGINVDYVFDIFNFKDIDFKGSASGVAYASRLLNKPIMETQLHVRNFSYNDGLLGDMDVHGEWDQKEEGIYVDADVQEKDVASVGVKGYIYPLKPKSGLDLVITPKHANMKFLEYYVGGIVSDIKGRASGRIHLHGPFSALNLEGDAVANATFKVDVLNTYFALEDSVHFTSERMTFPNAQVYDLEGHPGRVNGYISHKHFKNMKYRLDVNSNNMLVMNTAEDPDVAFYGNIYATGNALLSGDDRGLRVDAALTTNRNSNFVYTMTSTASAANSQFIRFVDKTPNINMQDSVLLASDFEIDQRRREEENVELDVRLNIQVDATPDATVKVIMDPASDDYISAKGNGNVRIEFFNKGDIKMFGNYTINQGVYKFSLQEVIRKDFQIKEGGNIVFSGDPNNAIIDLQAVYTVNSASLTDLVPEGTLSDFSQSVNRSVRVNCLMNLTGSLFRPLVKLDIDIPSSSSETQNLVRNYIRTDEDINMQILYLLAIGKFYTPDYVSTTQNSNMMTSVLSSTISGQLNRILSQIIDNNNWIIGTNLSTGDKGWTDMEVEGMLSGQLLNNRLLINGNFGYRDNPLANTNFVGDFDAEWLLTKSGEIRLKAYNETNDKYYTRTNLTTQGIGIIYRKDFDNWKNLFFWKRRKSNAKNKLRTDSISAGVTNDSISVD